MKQGAALLLVMLAVGCHDGQGAMPPGDSGSGSGSVVVSISVTPSADPQLQVTSGQLRFDEVSVFGDVQSTGASVHDATVDVTATQPQTLMLTSLPEGLYSLLRLRVERLDLAGSWRGTPFQLGFELEYDGTDLRAPDAPQLQPGATLTFPVGVDVGAWFAGVNLDEAVVANGQIVIDESQNPTLAQSIASAVASSFTLLGPVR